MTARSGPRPIGRSSKGVLPTLPWWKVWRQLCRWTFYGALFAVALITDRLRGRRRVGHHTRVFFERVGGTAVKIGQQLSLRADLLPQDVCDELALLTDKVPPMPEAIVIPLLEKSLGRPIGEVFSRVDRHAVGSGSVACVYQAWFVSGERVAVKILRPDVTERFAADLAVMDVGFWLLEAAALVRSDLFNHVRMDLRTLLGEETSLALEARYQRHFRRSLKKVDLPYIHVPRIYAEHSSDNVIVSEFVQGVPLNELLVAKETQSPRLAELAAQGIDPEIVAKRIVYFGLWARFEALFFHADPHPGNLIVQPDNQIVIIDFGGCGSTSSQTMRHRLEVVRHLVRLDPSAISGIMLSDLSPLPQFDDDSFRRAMDKPLDALIRALEDPTSHWSERMVSTVWLKMLEVTRQFQLRVNLDTLRSIRAFLLYDTVAFRLHPTITKTILEDYLHQVAERRAEKALRELRRMRSAPGFPLATTMALVERAERMVDYAMTRVARGYYELTAVAERSVIVTRAVLLFLMGVCLAGASLEIARFVGGAVHQTLVVVAVAFFSGYAVAALKLGGIGLLGRRVSENAPDGSAR